MNTIAKSTGITALCFAAAVGIAACSSTAQPTATATSSPASSPSKMMSQSPQVSPGSFIPLSEYEANKAKYQDTNVVYFFNAGWCPTCQEATQNLEAANGNLPKNLTVVDIDYDDSSALKEQYGVTVQHTFVEVDANGNMIKKWTGSSTPQQIESQVST